jgi:class 3 adenylate cyclase/tetratricopeptide (TPR) repeat protein
MGLATGGGVTCPSCAAEIVGAARFCPHCGARLGDALPPREERKLVSVLFVDLVGFTARSDRADPEDVRELLQLYFDQARSCIEQHGGVVEKFIGDAVMAVFGAPVAHGDDAERAVRAGLRVLAAVEELSRERGLGLAARAAVNTGEAVVSLSPGSGDPLATGDVVNTASRLQSAAPEGRLVVGATTFRGTRDAIAYEPLAPVSAKGKADALEAWVAVAPLAEPGTRRIRRTSLVGRTREVELLRSLWRAAVDDARPHLVTVVGPPGIGKSRLCRELASHVELDGGRLVRGRCLPYDERAGYQALTGIVNVAAGILESDTSAVAREKLDARIVGLVPDHEAGTLADHLALITGRAADVQARQTQLFFHAKRFLEALAEEQPLVAVFEDVHWAQPSELELLQYLAKHLRDARVLVVAAARPELVDSQPTWGGGLVAQTTIVLEPLRAAEAAELALQLIAPDDQSPVRLDRVVETAGGNPLFLEELAAAVAERTATDMPVTVREAIGARIDALPEDARSTLLAAAVVGRTFWRGAVDAVTDGDVDSALAELEVREFIRRDAASDLAGDVQFTFKHVLIRDVAYATVPRAVRRDRHAAVARYLEAAFGEAAESLAPTLAHHWREAGEPRRAIPYLVEAAERARRGWAQEGAIELYSLAVELADDDTTRRTLRLQRAIALVGWWEMERAADELQELLPELEGDERLEALIALGHAYVWTERDAEALDAAHEAAAAAPDAEGSTLGAILAMESQALGMRGGEGDLDRAWELGERALEAWQPGERPVDLAHHLHLQTDAAYWSGRYEHALELARRTWDVASDVHVAEAYLRGHGSEALSLAGLGRHEEAIAIWDALLPAAEEVGRGRAGLLNYSSLAYRELYDAEEAMRRSSEAFELTRELVSFTMPLQFAGSDAIFAALIGGDIGRAQVDWRERWERAGTARAWTTWLVAGRLTVARAEIDLEAGDAESALEWADRSLQVARRTRRRKYEARSLSLFGQALTMLGRKPEALAALRAAVPIADELIGPPARWEARAALGRCAYTLGEDDLAAEAYGEARELIRGFAATLSPERSARFLATRQVRAILE